MKSYTMRFSALCQPDPYGPRESESGECLISAQDDKDATQQAQEAWKRVQECTTRSNCSFRSLEEVRKLDWHPQ